jgi:hypothetical protein
MTPPIYNLPRDKSRARERDELAADIRVIVPAVNTLAEAERRRAVIRTCLMIARREKREQL